MRGQQPAAEATKKQRSHARILEAGAMIIARDGIQGMSVERVMRQAQLTVGGFYAHFKNKDSMIEEVIVASIQGQRQKLYDGLSELTPQEELRITIDRYLSPESVFGQSYRGASRPAGLAALVSDVARGALSVRQRVGRVFGSMVDQLSGTLERAGFPKEECHEKALLLLVMCVGGRALALALSGTDIGHKVLKVIRAQVALVAGISL